MQTPWGRADHVRQMGPGVWRCDTPSHGGYRVDANWNAKMHPALRRLDGWYEEDIEWCRVALMQLVLEIEDRFPVEAIDVAWRTLKDWLPDAYEAYTGNVLGVGESYVKDERDWHRLHADDWVAICAWGDWHKDVPKGFVAVSAVQGGRSPRLTNQPEGFFLVPDAEYRERGRAHAHGKYHAFLVDPERHREIGRITS